MKIRVGFEITYDCPQPTPMILTLSVHYSRVSDLVVPDHLVADPPVAMTAYRDTFGNWCSRIVAPKGTLRLSTDAVVRDSGLPDVAAPDARQTPVEALPDDTLLFLLGSRYCETDRLSDTAWQLFGATRPGWPRVQAICDYVHDHIAFGYEHARFTRTAWEALHDKTGVCRDYAHLAVAFCRCMNIPARYCTGLPRRHRHSAAVRTDGLRRVVRGLPRRALVHVRSAQQRSTYRTCADRARPRCLRCRDHDDVRPEHAAAVHRADGRSGWTVAATQPAVPVPLAQ
jgi:transglutaminase-like putative cysteine protease